MIYIDQKKDQEELRKFQEMERKRELERIRMEAEQEVKRQMEERRRSVYPRNTSYSF